MSTQTTSTPWYDALGEFTAYPLSRNITCDVCVVGAGIAGLTVAYHLAQAGRDAIVLDSSATPGGGETRYTTAHLASVIDDRFQEVARIRGEHAAKLAHSSHAAAIDRIQFIVRSEHIDCGFRRLDAFLFPAPGDLRTIEREFHAAKAAGCEVELVPELPMPSLGGGPCLRFGNQATFEPSRYVAGLWTVMQRRGLRFYGNTRVEDVTGGTPAEVRTADGYVIRANAVVVATNSPIHTRVAIHTKVAPYSTYAIAIPVPRGSVPDALFWDTLDPYHYIRLVTQADRGDSDLKTDLLVVGGNDHRTGQEPNPDQHWEDLDAWARQRLPRFGAPIHRWSGMVMETLDGLAYIGADPTGADNVYVVTGDSGMGMTHGTIAGLLISDLILGRSNPWEELYDPRRLPMMAAGEYVSEAASATAPYTDWVTGSDVDSVDEIKHGSGAVIRRGLSKLAIYRDDAGRLHTRSAVCPHLGGLVRWNSAEHTWDCPCHGSRFKATGEVIHGPAHCNLSPAETPAEHVAAAH
jgi:glycine/D-amino acid oxidase-like deaminating enzyme/nitrite reductase/ring-hydroxylating ferredoxin subunit